MPERQEEGGGASRILIAEDQAIVAMELEERLTMLGYDVVGVVSNGHRAVELAKELEPDLLLMDIRLANDTDGVTAAGQIRAATDIPVVFLTAHADQATVERAREVGPAGYLLKPFSERLLEITIDTALYRHRMEVAQAARERELRQVEARLASILQYSHDAIVGVNRAQRIIVFNQGAEQTFGWKAEEVLGEPLTTLLPEKLALSHDRLVEDFAGSESPGRFVWERGQVTGRRRGGSEFPAEVSISRVDVDGEVVFTAMVRDISARRSLERRFLLAQKLEAVGSLSASVAHDFNNVLSAIRCNAYLAELDFEREVPEYIHEITFAVERGSALTRQLLGFVRPRARERTVFDLCTVVRDMRPMLDRLLGENVTLTVDLNPTCKVNGDSSRMEQALLNLVLNARDAMTDGGRVHVRVALRSGPAVDAPDDIAGSERACLIVTDAGPGIPDEDLSRIFRPFFTTKSSNRGTGLGLATVAEVTREHGGTINVRSDDTGTRFELIFPVATGDLESIQVSAARPEQRPIDARVLVIDDDEAVRRATVRVLEHADVWVIEADGYESGLSKARRDDQLDLIICDVVMPDGNGPELMEELRRSGVNTPALFMTSYDAGYLEGRGIEVSSDMLCKPFWVADLLDAVTRKVATADRAKRPGEE